MPPPRTRARVVTLGLPTHARQGYGTELVGVPAQRAVLFTYTEPGGAPRLVCFALDRGVAIRFKGVRGELRGGVIEDDGRVHALTTHGLFELSIDRGEVVRSAKLAPWASTLTATPDGEHLLVHWRGKATAQRLVRDGYAKAGRVEEPAADPGARLGVDAKGRIVEAGPRGVRLVDPRTRKVIARIAAPAGAAGWTLAGPCTAVARRGRRLGAELIACEWDADARRPVIETSPVAPPPPAPRVSAGRLVIAKQTFHAIHATEVRAGLDLERCRFDWASVDGLRARVVVRDVRATRCAFSRVYAHNVVFEDCVVDQPKVTHGNALHGCMFRHVILRGDLGLVRLAPWTGENLPRGMTAARARALDAEVAAFYRDVDWSLDLRDADAASLKIGNVPLRTIRRDPARQLVVWREHADHAVWRHRAVARTLWPDDVEALRALPPLDAAGERTGVLLHVSAGVAEEKAALRVLRAAGVLD